MSEYFTGKCPICFSLCMKDREETLNEKLEIIRESATKEERLKIAKLEKQNEVMKAALRWMVNMGENHYEDCSSFFDEDEKCDCGGQHTFLNAVQALAEVNKIEGDE